MFIPGLRIYVTNMSFCMRFSHQNVNMPQFIIAFVCRYDTYPKIYILIINGYAGWESNSIIFIFASLLNESNYLKKKIAPFL